MTLLSHIATPEPPKSLMATLANEWASKLSLLDPIRGDDTVDVIEWIEDNFLVDRPRNPKDAAVLQAGPIRLADYQKRILKEALARDGDGKLKYSTVVWSEPKKSGKTAVAAAVGMYMAEINEASHIYCLANDGKQSQDRIFNAMARCITLHKKLGGRYQNCKATYSPPKIALPSGAVIEAIPCDAEGEAGSEPLMSIWSELWGYAQKHKERIWTELTIPPTLYGYALRWVESYAGYEGESNTLWQLYDVGVNHGERHPLFPDMPVYVNRVSNQLTFWSHEPRMPWQSKEYYAAEEKLLTPNEFLRVHRNQWVTSTTALFEDMIYWDRCRDPLAGPLQRGDMTPIIVGVDAGYAADCAAVVAVSRHPEDAWDAEFRRVVERAVIAFTPMPGHPLDFTQTIEPAIRKLCDDYNVYMVVYDPYQMHKLATDMQIQGIAPFKSFNQAGRRLMSDRQLYDMIIHRQFLHSGDPMMREHIRNTAKKEEGQHMRFMKKAANKPIDLTVALSMAVDECLTLNI